MTVRKRKRSVEDRDRALIAQVVRMINRPQPPLPAVGRAARAPVNTKLLRLMAADAASESVQEDWRRIWEQEKNDFAADLRSLATGKSARRAVLQEAVELMRPVLRFDAGEPRVDYEPVTPDALSTCAYVLLRISTGSAARLGRCLKCGTFFSSGHLGDGGRRVDFCTPEHRNAYGQAQWRKAHRRGKPSSAA